MPYLDDSPEKILGNEFEVFVGAYFCELRSCWKVLHMGLAFSSEDGGIDLIAFSEVAVYYIQCKNLRSGKWIHENVINQLTGAVNTFNFKHKDVVFPDRVRSVVVSGGAEFADDAVVAARANNVELLNVSYDKRTLLNDKLLLYNAEVSVPFELSFSENFFVQHAAENPELIDNAFNWYSRRLSGHSESDAASKPGLSSEDLRFAKVNGLNPDRVTELKLESHSEPACTTPSAPVKTQSAEAPYRNPWASDYQSESTPPDSVFQDSEELPRPSTTVNPHSAKGPAPDGKYFICSETPLKYHYLQRNILAPLNILSTVGAFFGPDYANTPLLLALDSIPVIAAILFIIGASRFTKYSYWSVFIWRFFSPACYAAMILVCLLAGVPDAALSSLPTLIAGLIWAVPTAIYYKKRKALFFPKLIPSSLVEYYEMDVPQPDRSPQKESFFTRHRMQLLIALVIAVCLLMVFSYDLLANSLNPKPIASPIPTIKATATIKPTVKPTATSKPTAKPTATLKANSKPSNGHYKGYWPAIIGDREWAGKLTVKTPDDGLYCCLVFVNAADPSDKCFSVFVWPDSEITIDVPNIDNLLLYTACGKNWIDYNQYFGESSIWSTSDDVFSFNTYIHTLTFEEVVNGNWTTKDIPQSQVPFLN